MKGKRVLRIAILVATLLAVIWPFVRVWIARPGDVLNEKAVTTIRLYSNQWWQTVHDEPWCGPVAGFTGCEFQGERLQALMAAVKQPGRSRYVWGSSASGAEFVYAIEVVFRDGDRRYLTVYSGMPAGTFYGVGPNMRVYTSVRSGWRYENSALARVAESILSQSATTQTCDPPVGVVRFGQVQSPEVEQRLKMVFETDQAARKTEPIDWESLKVEDAKRRAEVMKSLADGTVVSGWSQYYAAMVFQHGTCSEHYQLANQLAEKAMEQGVAPARWLYAATLDRFLLNQGKPQKYGTQYRIVGQKRELLPVDPATTDEERVKYNVPPLSQSR